MGVSTNVAVSRRRLRGLSVGRVRSLRVLSLSTRSLHSLLRGRSRRGPFVSCDPDADGGVSSSNSASFLGFVTTPRREDIGRFVLRRMGLSGFAAPR